MKVLMVEPGKSPYAAEIESGLKSLQAAVGGDIQAVYPYEDPVALICNEEGKLMGLPLNRALFDDDGHIYDIVSGNFLIVGLGMCFNRIIFSSNYSCSVRDRRLWYL